MAVTIHVNGKTNSLVHKGSMGIAKSTIPDVCKTPSPGGPVPIPYPVIVSMSRDLKKGTKTVKVDGKKMAAVKGSEFSRCMGDEPGTAGGGVKSSTNMKEATWILYSFDVKLDGKNACRLSDKMQMNHGNTACLAGIIQVPVLTAQDNPECTVACAIICCDKAEYKKTKHPPSGTKSGADLDCHSLSITKHSCVLHSLREKTKSGQLTQKPKKDFENIQASPHKPVGKNKWVIPDTIINGNKVIDAKFPCKKPAAPLPDKNGNSVCRSDMTKTKADMNTDKEDKTYINIKGVKDSEAMTPKDAENFVNDKENKCASCEPCEYVDV